MTIIALFSEIIQINHFHPWNLQLTNL